MSSLVNVRYLTMALSIPIAWMSKNDLPGLRIRLGLDGHDIYYYSFTLFTMTNDRVIRDVIIEIMRGKLILNRVT